MGDTRKVLHKIWMVGGYLTDLVKVEIMSE